MNNFQECHCFPTSQESLDKLIELGSENNLREDRGHNHLIGNAPLSITKNHGMWYGYAYSTNQNLISEQEMIRMLENMLKEHNPIQTKNVPGLSVILETLFREKDWNIHIHHLMNNDYVAFFPINKNQSKLACHVNCKSHNPDWKELSLGEFISFIENYELPEPPIMIGEDRVVFNKDKSITVGCTDVDYETLEKIWNKVN